MDTSRTPGKSSSATPGGSRRWLRKLGVVGFLFFLVKGILWLLVPAALVAWRAFAN